MGLTGPRGGRTPPPAPPAGGGGASEKSAPPGGPTAAPGALGAPLLVHVLGAPAAGATSLLAAAATETFPGDPPPALPGRTRLPPETLPDRQVPVAAVDTRRRGGEALGELLREREADVLVLCYAADEPASVDFLAGSVLPELQRLGRVAAGKPAPPSAGALAGHVPIVLVGCKSDKVPPGEPLPTEPALSRLLDAWSTAIDVCLLASAKQLTGCAEVFAHAQRAVLHPLRPVFDRGAARLTPLCERALRRAFLLCDRDGDGALNDEELNAFQVRCFGLPLRPDELAGIRAVVRAQVPGGLTDAGALSLPGFFFLHALFVLRQRIDTTWAVLREFGYGNDLRLTRAAVARGGLEGGPGGGGDRGGWAAGGAGARREAAQLDQLCGLSGAAPAWPELSTQALHFLENAFERFARGRTAGGEPALRVPQDLEALFASAPETPWTTPALARSVRLEAPAPSSAPSPPQAPVGSVASAAAATAAGAAYVLGRASYVAMWDLQMARDPEGAFALLLYLGWSRGAPAAFAVHGRGLGLSAGGAVSSAASLLRTPARRVARCFLLCSEGIGAGCLLDGLVGASAAAGGGGGGTVGGGLKSAPGTPSGAGAASPAAGTAAPGSPNAAAGATPGSPAGLDGLAGGAGGGAGGKAERWAASTFDVPGQPRGAALVLREVRDQDARVLAERGAGRGSPRGGLAGADVLLLAYAAGSLSSLRAVGSFIERFERAGSQVPCVLVVLEDSEGPLGPSSPAPGAPPGQAEEVALEAAALCQRFDLPLPLRVDPVGAAAGGQGGAAALFPAVLRAARCPQGRVPETAETRRGRETRRVLARALAYSAAGAAALAAGLWVYQAYYGGDEGARQGERGGGGGGSGGRSGGDAGSAPALAGASA